ncbi:phospholipase A2-like isoform X2 [Cotesia typhae]
MGQFHKTDKCCRDRDLCGFHHREVLLHFESKKDIATQLFGKPVCKCEHEFYSCLRKVNTFLSRNLGRLYFSVIRPKCFTYDHPSSYCIKYQGILQRRCLQYQVDTNSVMRVEERDNPYFFGKNNLLHLFTSKKFIKYLI